MFAAITERLHDVVWLQEDAYQRHNVTYTPYIFNDAVWIMPTATVEFREPLDERTDMANADNCLTAFLRPATYSTVWGEMQAHRAHLLIAEGTAVTSL